MKYKEFEGPAEELIRRKLREIEEKEQVKVLHGVEAGSRAWGFASPDSDYDVRFIYVRPLEYYLSLQPAGDYIEGELDETLDINGWDCRKALQHFHKSNATLFEWRSSPIVYHTTPEWEQIKKASANYFSCRSAMYHYYGTARKNEREFLQEDMVKYKKYLYVLRPLLACRWIEQKASPPPVLFRELAEEVLEREMVPVVEKLLQAKAKMPETQKGRHMQRLDEYIQEKLLYYKEKTDTMTDDRNKDWEELNRLFRHIIGISQFL